jgi:hypothetical protein
MKLNTCWSLDSQSSYSRLATMTFWLSCFSSSSVAGAFFLPVTYPSRRAPQRVARTWTRYVVWLFLPSFSVVGCRTTGIKLPEEEALPPAMYVRVLWIGSIML